MATKEIRVSQELGGHGHGALREPALRKPNIDQRVFLAQSHQAKPMSDALRDERQCTVAMTNRLHHRGYAVCQRAIPTAENAAPTRSSFTWSSSIVFVRIQRAIPEYAAMTALA